MAIEKWVPKENVSARKLNNNGLRRMDEADKTTVADEDRLSGDMIHNKTTKALERYQRGTGGTYITTEVSNFIVRNDTEIGIGSTKQTVGDEDFTNRKGLSNNRLIINVTYKQEVSVASEVEVVLTDGTTPVSDLLSLGSNGSPVKSVKQFVLDTTGYTLEVGLNLKVKIKNAIIYNYEVRGV